MTFNLNFAVTSSTMNVSYLMPRSAGRQFAPPRPPPPPDVVCEAGVGVVAGGEVLGVLPPVLVRPAGRVVVHHPVSAPRPSSAGQADALLGAAVQA